MTYQNTYPNVRVGNTTGTLTFTEDQIIFQSSSDAEGEAKQLTLPWDRVGKQQISPASNAKALLRLFPPGTNSGPAKTFKFADREALMKVSKDVKARLLLLGLSNDTGSVVSEWSIVSSSRRLEASAPYLSAPPEHEVIVQLPEPLKAPIFRVDDWNANKEPIGMTRLRSGESFLDGVRRVAKRLGGDDPVSAGCESWLPGMRVAQDQIGIVFNNGAVKLRPAGAYVTTVFNPWKTHGAVIPVQRQAGVEFDPLLEAGKKKKRIARMELGQTYRQIVLQAQQIAVFEDQVTTRTASSGTFVYDSETEMRGVIDLNRMDPVFVERETEDTVAATSSNTAPNRVDMHGRVQPTGQGHGTTVKTTKRIIPSGYIKNVAGIIIARPEKGFIALHKDANNRISMTEGICIASGSEDFVRHTKDSRGNNTRTMTMADLEIEFGDLNHYAKSTPMLELKSKDNIDGLCRVQIKWNQTRPDVWVAQRGAFTDPFDMLEEKWYVLCLIVHRLLSASIL